MENILLVEDEPVNCAVLAAYLRKAGYTVDEAGDGKAALEILMKNPNYAIVVTDRRMPNMDGLDLFTHMQAAKDLRNIPVIMQTAATRPEEVMEGIRAGVYYYLAKPYQEDTLVTLVKSAIRDRRKKEIFETRFVKQSEALNSFVKGEFHLRTMEEGQNIALLLGSLFPRPELAVNGLYELLINAIEHGNLAIGFDEKARLLSVSQWDAEIQKRLAMPENAAKKVTVQFMQYNDKIEMSIIDDGLGFNWQPFLQIEPSRATQANGRGIAKANLLSFDKLSYQGNGNHVVVMSRKGE